MEVVVVVGGREGRGRGRRGESSLTRAVDCYLVFLD